MCRGEQCLSTVRHLGFILAGSKSQVAPTDVLDIIGSALHLVHGVTSPESSSLYSLGNWHNLLPGPAVTSLLGIKLENLCRWFCWEWVAGEIIR